MQQDFNKTLEEFFSFPEVTDTTTSQCFQQDPSDFFFSPQENTSSSFEDDLFVSPLLQTHSEMNTTFNGNSFILLIMFNQKKFFITV
jgi:hypothetical protein